MKDCVFCKILNGEIPCMKLYEDDLCIAFLDVNPDSDGHTLIIPKKHYKDIYSIPSEVLLHVYDVSKKIMDKLKKKLGCTGFSLLQNNGSIQEVKHYHLHVKPYYKDKKSMELIKYENLIEDPKKVFTKINEE